jgi:hypothetical protein
MCVCSVAMLASCHDVPTSLAMCVHCAASVILDSILMGQVSILNPVPDRDLHSKAMNQTVCTLLVAVMCMASEQHTDRALTAAEVPQYMLVAVLQPSQPARVIAPSDDHWWHRQHTFLASSSFFFDPVMHGTMASDSQYRALR